MIDGEIADGMAYCARTVADDLGRFRFPPQDTSFRLIVTHSSGYALIKSAPDWELTSLEESSQWMTTVDRDGRFCVEDMPPGSFWLVARFKQDPSAHIWVYRLNVAAQGGNTLDEQVDLGELKPDE